MLSEAATVEEYVAEANEERRQALEILRGLCLEELVGYDEGMEYRMPSYSRNGAVEVAFANQKNHVSFYVLRGSVLGANSRLLDGLSVGKGCIRYSRPQHINPAVVRALLAGSVADAGPIC